MSTTNHIAHLLQDHLDGALPADVRQDIARHLAACPACRAEYDEMRELFAKIQSLPDTIAPANDLWKGIEARIKHPSPRQMETAPMRESERAADRSPVNSALFPKRSRRFGSRRWLQGIAVMLLIGLSAIWWISLRSEQAWDVVSLEGRPWVGGASMSEKGRLRVGQWLETDAASRARLDVGMIGRVDVAPETRLQLREAQVTDHRLVLEEGRIDAFIWAPPRLFFVETPSALAIDLGCAYTLTVDSTGTSLLHVTSGYVELDHPDRASVVPAGAMCLARPGKGPGTPFDEEASPALRSALTRYDFEDGGEEALADVLAEAGPSDAVTLWHLLLNVAESERSRIYERFAALAPPPPSVTREGILRHDPDMIQAWARQLGLNVVKWKSVKKKLPGS